MAILARGHASFMKHLLRLGWREEFHTDFFFQAEDGIRDGRVTGVQTCALPIWPWVRGRFAPARPEWPPSQKARTWRAWPSVQRRRRQAVRWYFRPRSRRWRSARSREGQGATWT